MATLTEKNKTQIKSTENFAFRSGRARPQCSPMAPSEARFWVLTRTFPESECPFRLSTFHICPFWSESQSRAPPAPAASAPRITELPQPLSVHVHTVFYICQLCTCIIIIHTEAWRLYQQRALDDTNGVGAGRDQPCSVFTILSPKSSEFVRQPLMRGSVGQEQQEISLNLLRCVCVCVWQA